MNKTKLNIIAIADSQSSVGQYVLVFEAEGTDKRITINVGRSEAQSIAVHLQQQDLKRPMTHDLMKTVLEAGQLHLKEIRMVDLVDDIFYAKLVLIDDDGSQVQIDARMSDAVALALRCDRHMFIHDDLLARIGLSTDLAYAIANQPKTLKDFSADELKNMLQESVSKEAFKRAARIRDELKRRASE